MNEVDKLEQRADVLMRQLELNAKKIRQSHLKDKRWDTNRVDATLRIISEIRDLSQMINELYEYASSELNA